VPPATPTPLPPTAIPTPVVPTIALSWDDAHATVDTQTNASYRETVTAADGKPPTPGPPTPVPTRTRTVPPPQTSTVRPVPPTVVPRAPTPRPPTPRPAVKPAPTVAPAKPAPATGSGVRIGAICRDGTRSTATGRGACSHHGGVAQWLSR
jgi:hypothetical protein